MRTHFWVSLFVLGLVVGNVNAQQGLQLGVIVGGGRTFTTVDYSQATATQLTGSGGFSSPLGIEIAWFHKPKLRVSTGLTYSFQNMKVNHHTRQWGSPMSIDHGFLSIPLDVSYRLFTEQYSKKSFWLIGGISGNLINGQGSSSIARSSPNQELAPGPGETQIFGASSVAAINASLRIGLGQAWVFGKNKGFTLQTNIMYSQGLSPIWEGEFLYWDQAAPFEWWRGQNGLNDIIDVMPEPTGSYNSILTRGSALTMEVKLLFNFGRKEKMLIR
jgi:hypothetical protein